MQSAPLRDNEQASLDALVKLGVLDTDPEPEFDALVQAASALCGVPVSVISLVGADRQWFKANVGLPGLTETTRDIALCAHAVRCEGFFEIPDTADDRRFADNPLVVGDPHIRFYAAAPISLSSGETVGALCVMDRQPRRLQDSQRAGLGHLAVAAAAALESRRARRLLEGTIRQSHRTAMLLQHTADAVIGLSEGGLIVLWNPAATVMFGYTEAEMIGQTFAILTPAVNHQRQRDVLRALADGEARTYDSVGIHRSGNTLALSITSVPEIDAAGRLLGATAFLRDTSVRERAERELQDLVDERTAALQQANEAAAAAHRASIERLNAEREAKLQSSKLEAVGTLAAGIAHDFNNILASIVAHAELAQNDLPDGSEAKNSVAKIISGSFRARDLVARMLDFARGRPFDPMPMDVVLQVREAIALLRASLPPSIEMDFQNGMRAASTMILADPTRIMQIVINLCINAAHAMENRGVIVVSLDRAGDIAGAPREHADGVCLTVADCGSGIAPEVLERIFDPFFTTKPPGEGSGLGLSVVYGIVKDLSGIVKVDSSVRPNERGTRFQVFLPATSPSPSHGRPGAT